MNKKKRKNWTSVELSPSKPIIYMSAHNSITRLINFHEINTPYVILCHRYKFVFNIFFCLWRRKYFCLWKWVGSAQVKNPNENGGYLMKLGEGEGGPVLRCLRLSYILGLGRVYSLHLKGHYLLKIIFVVTLYKSVYFRL